MRKRPLRQISSWKLINPVFDGVTNTPPGVSPFHCSLAALSLSFFSNGNQNAAFSVARVDFDGHKISRLPRSQIPFQYIIIEYLCVVSSRELFQNRMQRQFAPNQPWIGPIKRPKEARPIESNAVKSLFASHPPFFDVILYWRANNTHRWLKELIIYLRYCHKIPAVGVSGCRKMDRKTFLVCWNKANIYPPAVRFLPWFVET